MPQKDYILRVAEDVGRALAQILYHKEIRDYQGALSLTRSSSPRKDIRGIVGDFLEAYVDADTVLCSVCKKTKTVYVRQQWLRVWEQVVRQIQQQESANGLIL